MSLITEDLREAIHRRLAADAWILAPGGTWMLSLEAILRR